MLLFISIILALVIGWSSHWLYNRVRLVLLSRRPVIVAPGESGIERYQRLKEARRHVENLKPIPPPPGVSPDAAIRFNKLTPQVQHKVIAARKERGLDG